MDYPDISEVLANANRVIASTEALLFNPVAGATSIVLICDQMGRGWGSMLSDLLHYEGLVSEPEGFSPLPVDDDHVFHIRSITVPYFTDEQWQRIASEVATFEWAYPEVVSLTVKRDEPEWVLRWVPTT